MWIKVFGSHKIQKRIINHIQNNLVAIKSFLKSLIKEKMIYGHQIMIRITIQIQNDLMAIRSLQRLLIEIGLSPPSLFMKIMIWWPLDRFDNNGRR
jgi:hypothetical protein